MVESPQIVQILVQAGGLGLALASLFIIWYIVRALINHLHDVTEKLALVGTNLEKLAAALDYWRRP